MKFAILRKQTPTGKDEDWYVDRIGNVPGAGPRAFSFTSELDEALLFDTVEEAATVIRRDGFDRGRHDSSVNECQSPVTIVAVRIGRSVVPLEDCL